MSNEKYECIKSYPGVKIGAVAKQDAYSAAGWFKITYNESFLFNQNESYFDKEFWKEIRTPILTTIDWINIFAGDTYWFVHEFVVYKQVCLSSGKLNPEAIRFSTEKLANEWVDLNKPKYSLRDIKNAIQAQCGKWKITTDGDLCLIDLSKL